MSQVLLLLVDHAASLFAGQDLLLVATAGVLRAIVPFGACSGWRVLL